MKKPKKVKKALTYIVLLLIFAGCNLGFEEDIENYEYKEEVNEVYYTDERHRRWVYDINHFRNLAFARHPRFSDRYLERVRFAEALNQEMNDEIKSDFNNALNILMHNVPYLTDFEVLTNLQKAAALLQDSHTSFRNFFGIYWYPVHFMWSEDNIYLVRIHQDYSHLLNYRLISVNDVSVDEIIKRINRFSPFKENKYSIRANGFNGFLRQQKNFKALGIADSVQITYTFENTQGEKVSVTLNPMYMPDIIFAESRDGFVPLFEQNRELINWYTFIEEKGILYVRINSLNGVGVSPTLTLFRKLQNTIEDYDIEVAIVDLRNNGGGHHRPELVELVVDNSPAVYTFINESSLSGALIAAVHLKSLGAVTIGQPSGQNLVFFTQTGAFGDGFDSRHLPYSGYGFSLSGQVWALPLKYNIYFPQDHIFRPDVLIDYTLEDWIYGRDPFLEFVLESFTREYP